MLRCLYRYFINCCSDPCWSAQSLWIFKTFFGLIELFIEFPGSDTQSVITTAKSEFGNRNLGKIALNEFFDLKIDTKTSESSKLANCILPEPFLLNKYDKGRRINSFLKVQGIYQASVSEFLARERLPIKKATPLKHTCAAIPSSLLMRRKVQAKLSVKNVNPLWRSSEDI